MVLCVFFVFVCCSFVFRVLFYLLFLFLFFCFFTFADIYQEIKISRTLVTEDVVKRIIENRLKYENRNAKREKKELAYLEKKEFVAEI